MVPFACDGLRVSIAGTDWLIRLFQHSQVPPPNGSMRLRGWPLSRSMSSMTMFRRLGRALLTVPNSALCIFIDRLSVVDIRNRGRAEFGTVSRALPSLRNTLEQVNELYDNVPKAWKSPAYRSELRTASVSDIHHTLIDHGVYEHEGDPAETTPDPENVGLGWVECSSEFLLDRLRVRIHHDL
jgi:hypothetical protein